MRSYRGDRRLYFFTDALRDELRSAYVGDMKHLSSALDKLQALTKWPRHAFTSEARKLGLELRTEARRWTAEEDEYLREHLGQQSPWAIGRHLGRTQMAVQSRAAKLRLSGQVSTGYCISDLAEVFGVRRARVGGWVSRGLLGRPVRWQGTRVAESAVLRFVHRYPHEYDLRRVDELWFKSIVFGKFAAISGEKR
jgi:hypothetical protein